MDVEMAPVSPQQTDSCYVDTGTEPPVTDNDNLSTPVTNTNTKPNNGDITSNLTFSETEKKRISYWITEKMAYRPWSSCGLMFSIILLIVIIVVVTGMADVTVESQYDWDIPSSAESQNNDALTSAKDQVDLLGVSGTRTRVYDYQFFYLFTSRDGTDLYTPENVLNMCNVESFLAKDPKYPQFCMLDANGNCQLPGSSISVYFYEFQNISDWQCSLLNSSVVNQKKTVLYDAMLTTVGVENYGIWLSKDSPSKGFSTKANSVWIFGAPLEGYTTSVDRDTEQVRYFALCCW